MSDRNIHTELVQARHAYTQSKSPWIIGECQSRYGKLIHYISGGGMRAFGRTVEQEISARRHRRFVIYATAIVMVWLCFLVF